MFKLRPEDQNNMSQQRFSKSFRITFLPENKTVEIDPRNFKTTHHGEPGSILDIALSAGIDIDHACGGVCACSTCHVIIRKGLSDCNKSTEDEDDQLDKAPGLTPQSRLSCQCLPKGNQDLIVEVPNWNRNLVKETHE